MPPTTASSSRTAINTSANRPTRDAGGDGEHPSWDAGVLVSVTDRARESSLNGDYTVTTR